MVNGGPWLQLVHREVALNLCHAHRTAIRQNPLSKLIRPANRLLRMIYLLDLILRGKAYLSFHVHPPRPNKSRVLAGGGGGGELVSAGNHAGPRPPTAPGSLWSKTLLWLQWRPPHPSVEQATEGDVAEALVGRLHCREEGATLTGGAGQANLH